MMLLQKWKNFVKLRKGNCVALIPGQGVLGLGVAGQGQDQVHGEDHVLDPGPAQDPAIGLGLDLAHGRVHDLVPIHVLALHNAGIDHGEKGTDQGKGRTPPDTVRCQGNNTCRGIDRTHGGETTRYHHNQTSGEEEEGEAGITIREGIHTEVIRGLDQGFLDMTIGVDSMTNMTRGTMINLPSTGSILQTCLPVFIQVDHQTDLQVPRGHLMAHQEDPLDRRDLQMLHQVSHPMGLHKDLHRIIKVPSSRVPSSRVLGKVVHHQCHHQVCPTHQHFHHHHFFLP